MSTKRLSIFLTVLLSIAGLLGSCEAPRINPLDPNNPDNVLHFVRGTVVTDAGTPAAIVDVGVWWSNEAIEVRTNGVGAFTITTTRPTDGWLRFEKVGFTTDSAFVHWAGQKSLTIRQSLDARPSLDSLLVSSIVKNRYSQKEYSLAVEAKVLDDDDIDSVWIANSALNIRKALTKISAAFFQGRFLDYTIPISSLEELVGKPLSIVVKSRNNTVDTVGNGILKRVIQQEIEPLSPLNQDTVATRSPLLRWRRFTPGFQFMYSLEVYTDEQDPLLVWSRTNVSSDSISCVIEPAISLSTVDNRFFWVIWCTDEFNNKSRSKPASFILPPP